MEIADAVDYLRAEGAQSVSLMHGFQGFPTPLPSAYLQRIALPPDAVIDVQLQDVSLQDVPVTVIAAERYVAAGRLGRKSGRGFYEYA